MTSAEPAYRRFVSDMIREVIPVALLRYPELAALDVERKRLAQALYDAQHSIPTYMTDAEYVAARAQALLNNTPLPPAPPPPAEQIAAKEQQQRDVQAATNALLTLGDKICEAVRKHPEWEREARNNVATSRAHAVDLSRQAAEAERQAAAAEIYVLWTSHVAADELFVVTLPS